MTVAALYVQAGGCYAGLEGVELWDEARDARLYPGPHPVVAHPPCTRWCRLAGLVEARWGHRRGEDGGCFAAALAAVRKWGGVLEHPAWSDAWPAFGLPAPPTGGGWHGDIWGGWSCYVEQGAVWAPREEGDVAVRRGLRAAFASVGARGGPAEPGARELVRKPYEAPAAHGEPLPP